MTKGISDRTFDFALETFYWLRLLGKSGYLSSYQREEELLEEIKNLINILTKIVKTS